MKAAFPRVVALCAVLLAGCGADGVNAPASPLPPDCPGLDARLAPLYALQDAGKLVHLQRAVAVDLGEDARSDVVDALLRMLPRFAPGTFESLAGWAEGGGSEPGLTAALARALRLLAAFAPEAPYPLALEALRGVIATCDGAPILGVAADVLADDALLHALADALAEGGLKDALAGLQVDAASGREALRLLLRNLLVAASSPDFDVRTLLDLLGFIVDLDAPPWPDLVRGVTRFLSPGPALDAVQGLLICLLAVDPDAHLGPPLFDVLTSDAVDLLGALGPPASADASVLPAELTVVITTALRYLADDPEARRALATAARVFLRADVAPGVAVDLAELLDADVLGDLLRLVATIASRTCAL